MGMDMRGVEMNYNCATDYWLGCRERGSQLVTTE
jgi:hypothetical protein